MIMKIFKQKNMGGICPGSLLQGFLIAMLVTGIWVVDALAQVDLRIGGQWVYVRDDGSFTARIPVPKGRHELSFVAVDMQGNRLERAITVLSAVDPPALRIEEGRRLALLIGNQDYKDRSIPDLDTPVADATALAEVLADQFGYETRVMVNAGKGDMVEAFRGLGRELTINDRLLIFYAGHGYSFEDSDEGYWLAADAGVASVENWISTTDLSRFLHRVPARQILVVSDSCYSGTLTREGEVRVETIAGRPEDLQGKRAVMVFSSGGDEPVWDGGADGHSIFAARMMGVLRDAEKVRGYDVFEVVHDLVIAEAPQTPHYGAIFSAGYDTGGDFLYVPAPSR